MEELQHCALPDSVLGASSPQTRESIFDTATAMPPKRPHSNLGASSQSIDGDLEANSGDEQRIGAKQRRVICDDGLDQDTALASDAMLGDLDYDEDSESEGMDFEDSSAQSIPRPTLVHGGAAQSGVLESVDLVNFMCHRHLHVSLSPRLNFIIGHNGSGKSAILTAITICLGGKASATQRATSLKGLIREGAAVAQITCKLRNRGDEAFQHEKYGDCIIVERRIHRDGGSQYQLKNASGKVVSKKRDDLDAILDQFSIQVSNPLNVLTQDLARAFLSNSTPEQKYQFFLKGTQLDQLNEEYNTVRANYESTKDIIRRKQSVIPDMLKKVNDLKAKRVDMQQARELAGRLEQLKDQMAWGQVEEIEKDHGEVASKLARAEGKIPALELQIAEEVDRIKEKSDAVVALEAELQTIATESAPQQNALKKLQEDERAVKVKINAIKTEEREIDTVFKAVRAKAADYKSKIAQEKLAAAKNSSEALQQVGEDVVRLEGEMNDISLRMDQASMCERGKEIIIEAEVRSHRDAIRNVKAEIGRENSELARLRRDLASTQGQRTNKLALYGAEMPGIIRDIHAERRFHERPIGPLGMHVKLRNQKWASIVESLIGSGLSDFLVRNHDDRKLLFSIIERHARGSSKIRVHVAAEDLFDYSLGEPDSRFLTIFRCLEFDDEHVKRQFINSFRIEQSILVEGREEAERIMHNDGRGFPRNVCACYTVSGYQVGSRAGRSTIALESTRNGPARLSGSVESRIMALQADLESCEARLHKLKQTEHTVTQTLHDAEDRARAIRNTIADLSQNMSRRKGQIQTLRLRLQVDEPANIAAMEEVLRETETELDTVKAQFLEASRIHRGLSDEHTAKSSEVQEATKVVNDAFSRNQLNAAIQERVGWEGKHGTTQRRLADAVDKLEHIREELAASAERVAGAQAKAISYCPERVKPSKTCDKLDMEIRHVQKRIQEAERGFGCTIEEVETDLKAKTEAFIRVRHELTSMISETHAILTSLRERMRRLTLFRLSIGQRAQRQFQWYLAQRGYAGSLEFDHEKRSLNPRVQTDDVAEPGTCDKDARSLSGGEKSFSTICMLLSLWEAMGSPIRCLDEFDVFMDAVNRRTSMKLMIDCAKESESTQFILITPQDMSSINLDPSHDKVIRLSDPERNQSTLTHG